MRLPAGQPVAVASMCAGHYPAHSHTEGRYLLIAYSTQIKQSTYTQICKVLMDTNDLETCRSTNVHFQRL